MAKAVVNNAASVHQRLLNLARERKEDFGLVLTKYVLERVLYRISQSKYRDVFVLKGALLFELWTAQRYRPTRNADFLARGENTPERFITIFKEMCRAEVLDDGLRFDPASVTAERISEDADYEGIRVKFVGYLENARAPVQIDMGFWRRHHACPKRGSISNNAGPTRTQAPDVSEGKCYCREIRGTGYARRQEQRHEGSA
jgi:hypothetical protein